jgi:hypothetical protein
MSEPDIKINEHNMALKAYGGGCLLCPALPVFFLMSGMIDLPDGDWFRL